MIRNYNKNEIDTLNIFYNDIFNIKKNYDEESNIIRVFEENNQIIGFIDYSILYERAELNYIFIIDEYKSHGYATLLMQNMLDDLKNNGVLSITLEVNVNNEKAIKLYEKMCFKTINKREKYYLNGEDGYLMYREV